MNLPPKAIIKKLKTPSEEPNTSITIEEIQNDKKIDIKNDKSPDIAECNTTATLPVLETFKHFLHAEQKKYRQNVITIFLALLLVIIIIITVSSLFIFHLNREIKHDFSNIYKTINDYESSYKELSEKTSTAMQNVIAKYSLMEKEMLEKSQKYENVTQEINDKTKSYQEELEKTKKELIAIRNEFIAISNMLNSIRKIVIEPNIEIPILSTNTITAESYSNKANDYAITSISNKSITIKIPITDNGTNSISWQIPLME